MAVSCFCFRFLFSCFPVFLFSCFPVCSACFLFPVFLLPVCSSCFLFPVFLLPLPVSSFLFPVRPSCFLLPASSSCFPPVFPPPVSPFPSVFPVPTPRRRGRRLGRAVSAPPLLSRALARDGASRSRPSTATGRSPTPCQKSPGGPGRSWASFGTPRQAGPARPPVLKRFDTTEAASVFYGLSSSVSPTRRWASFGTSRQGGPARPSARMAVPMTALGLILSWVAVAAPSRL